MKKKVISVGEDYTYMMPIFRELVLKSGVKEQDNLIFAGCQGACYSMATYFSFGIRELNLNLHYAVDADIHQLRRLEYVENLGVVATRKVDPVEARVIVLMSGLCRIPFDDTLKFVKDALAADGIVIGQTVVPGLFDELEWDKQIPFNFLFEYSIKNPTSFEISTMH